MKTNHFLLFLILIFISSNSLHTQPINNDKARELYKKAIKLVDDEQKYDEAIEVYKEAEKYDPETIVFPYEIAFTYYLKKDYKKAIEIANPLLEREDVFSEIYRLVGNAYDMCGKKEKAIEAYKKGLEKFPDAGKLYHELGIVEMNRGNPSKAVQYYEKGVSVNPKYPSNYYELTKIYCKTTEKIWGVIYGEIFMHIEPDTKRTQEISKLLYETYYFALDVADARHKQVSFTKNIVTNQKVESLPFTINFEMNMALCIIDVNKINIKSLNKIRTRFIKKWFERGLDKEYPVALFDWQRDAVKKGYFKSYNYWLFNRGAESEFDKWYDNNKDDFKSFAKWFVRNQLDLNIKNCFVRTKFTKGKGDDSLKMDWKTKEQYEKDEQKILNVINWLEDNPFTEEKELRKLANAYVLRWFTGVPYITLDISTDFVLGDYKKVNDESGLILTSFMYAKGAYLIKHKDNPDELEANIAGVESALRIYEQILQRKPGFSIPVMDGYIGLKTDKELEDLVRSKMNK